MIRAGIGAMILPAATTYGRSAWKRNDNGLLWVRAFFFNEPLPEDFACVLHGPTPVTTLKAYKWSLPREDLDRLLKAYPMPPISLIENFSHE